MRYFGAVMVLCAFTFLAMSCSHQNSGSGKANYTGDPANDVTEAVKAGDMSKVRKLITENAALLEQRDEQGRTLLHTAVLYDRPDIVDFLIQKGIDPNVQDNSEMTPLDAIDQSGFRAVAARKALMKHIKKS